MLTQVVRRAFSSSARLKMRIVPVPVRSDNYAYLLIDDASKEAAAIDPFDVKKVVAAAEKEGVTLGRLLLTTHHHNDHAGGNNDFAAKFHDAKIYGGSKQVQGVTDFFEDGKPVEFGTVRVTPKHTPCHTQDHMCLFTEDTKTDQKAVFSGDTLFIAGNGRFFEGTPKEMDHALNTVLSSLPDETVVYPGHEYTKSNVKFALTVDPDNQALQKLKKYCDEHESTTGVFTLADEKQHNVFMRLESPAVTKVTHSNDTATSMGILREMKNNS
ncbi:uncharacterized protein L969DRAFT_252858 [Mixia osmundae IAM 14324]|uniref:hydroxyacylglutathione hydrolase n=1 Tax=Mixia osmundae (strain CBS 9802 / IAM 14324 / JCM 22182 / KY 12970) TaxID=764103 RepID=G7E1S8_MIXOS|nr:uncharacterized protein L969DRAFT_252858 [Mixia osmundae IAM 14324]KEI36737.1 hypothetical protein L969DRAFT_252858 [Mixia osmundae IAM 14324]GAA96788.1 hypothetical protein E5Q_03459 [Mixia osmundae IAM 14324]